MNGLSIADTGSGYHISGELTVEGKMGEVSIEGASILLSFDNRTGQTRIPIGDIIGGEGPRPIEFRERITGRTQFRPRAPVAIGSRVAFATPHPVARSNDDVDYDTKPEEWLA